MSSAALRSRAALRARNHVCVSQPSATPASPPRALATQSDTEHSRPGMTICVSSMATGSSTTNRLGQTTRRVAIISPKPSGTSMAMFSQLSTPLPTWLTRSPNSAQSG